MLPDDDSYRKAQDLRGKEWLLALVLAVVLISSSACYLIFLKNLGNGVVALLIASDALVIVGIYFLLVSKMRKRGGSNRE